MTVIVRVIARLLLAPSYVVAAAIMVKGSSGVGDGFSAGVIVVLAVALQYIALGAETAEAGMPLLRFAPALAGVGFGVALAVGFFPLLRGEPPFSHLPPPGHEPVSVGKLELVTPVAFDVGVFLLVVGGLSALLHMLAQGGTRMQAGVPDEHAGGGR